MSKLTVLGRIIVMVFVFAAIVFAATQAQDLSATIGIGALAIVNTVIALGDIRKGVSSK